MCLWRCWGGWDLSADPADQPGKAALIWLEAGLAALVEEGGPGLTIERLCARTDKTRGSFYHHFEDHDGFIRALVALWWRRQTEEVIARTKAAPSQSAALHETVRGLDHRLDVAMRRFGGEHMIAGAGVAAVDDRRLRHLAGLYRAAGKDEASALDLARVEYALLVGWQMLWSDQAMPDHDRLSALLQAMVGR